MFNQGQGVSFGGGCFGQLSGGYCGFGGLQCGVDVIVCIMLDFVIVVQGEMIFLQGEDGKLFKVKIFVGVVDGQKICLCGCGCFLLDGGESGDIVVQIMVCLYFVFMCDGFNLCVVVLVMFIEVIFGVMIEVLMFSGDVVKFCVVFGIFFGWVLCVKGCGVKILKGIGDFFVEFQVVVLMYFDDVVCVVLEKFQEFEFKENLWVELMVKVC